jgi:hypothetical protein
MRYDFTFQQAALARAQYQRAQAIVEYVLWLFRRTR